VVGHTACCVAIHVEPGTKKPFKKKVLKNKSKLISEEKMTNQTTENFLEVFNNLTPWQPPTVLFRVYYDDAGLPTEYSQENKPGKYIDVDPTTWIEQNPNIKIINGKIVKFDPKKIIKKLAPNQSTGTCTSTADVCIIVDSTTPHTKWNLTTYETN
jgi:hypothetical protein